MMYNFTYDESVYVNGNLVSRARKYAAADNLEYYYRFKELWQELETDTEDDHYYLLEAGDLENDGKVCLVLAYTLVTDTETIKYVRGVACQMED